MKKSLLVVTLLALISCTHYATTTRPESDNVINAPVNIVWEKALNILPAENITITLADKRTYSILGVKGMTLWSIASDIAIQLMSKNKKQTIMNISSESKSLLIGGRHEEKRVIKIFNKIKRAAENHMHN